jgi:CRISPR system Cascade subunit CasC
MFIELHILQNFGPSNLNRNDVNAPKDCTFGGFRRARISSQCLKRAIRKHDAFKNTILSANGNLGERTKRLVGRLVKLLEQQGHDSQAAEKVAKMIIAGAGLGFDKNNGEKTQYLLYLGQAEIEKLAEIAHQHWDNLINLESSPATATETEEQPDKKKTKKSNKVDKKAGKEALSKEVQTQINHVFSKSANLAADIALFGRMVADVKNMNIDAACQVAHAISTNEMAMEMDFFTAVDDLLSTSESGSDMLGIVEFNSACYYRYAQINLDILRANLAADQEMVVAAILGFLAAAVQAIPTGMQNSMAALNPPSYIRVLIRSAGSPWSLSNAFITPVRPKRHEESNLIALSIAQLENYLTRLQTLYGKEGFELDSVCTDLANYSSAITFPNLLKTVKDFLQQPHAGSN